MVKREKSGSAGAGHEVAHTMPAGVSGSANSRQC